MTTQCIIYKRTYARAQNKILELLLVWVAAAITMLLQTEADGALRIISGRRFSKGGWVPLPARSAEAFDEI